MIRNANTILLVHLPITKKKKKPICDSLNLKPGDDEQQNCDRRETVGDDSPKFVLLVQLDLLFRCRIRGCQCQCFDIEDFQNGNTIERYRCWDSCMYHDFTLMAAGTPRKTQLERFRQRFMHKLVYYPKAHDGLYSCVGCGRCLRKCPIHMNIAKVMQALKEENAHE